MRFHNGCITRYYTTESKMGFLRRNGVFPPAAFRSALLARLLLWCINHWPLHQLTCLLPCFREICLVESPRREAALRAEVLGECWLPALQPCSCSSKEARVLRWESRRKGNHGAKPLVKKHVLAYRCTGKRCLFFPSISIFMPSTMLKVPETLYSQIGKNIFDPEIYTDIVLITFVCLQLCLCETRVGLY